MANTCAVQGYELLVQEKAKLCLEALVNATKNSLELRKRSAKDNFLREQAEEQVKALEQQIQVQERERKPELTQMLDLANEVCKQQTTRERKEIISLKLLKNKIRLSEINNKANSDGTFRKPWRL